MANEHHAGDHPHAVVELDDVGLTQLLVECVSWRAFLVARLCVERAPRGQGGGNLKKKHGTHQYTVMSHRSGTYQWLDGWPPRQCRRRDNVDSFSIDDRILDKAGKDVSGAARCKLAEDEPEVAQVLCYRRGRVWDDEGKDDSSSRPAETGDMKEGATCRWHQWPPRRRAGQETATAVRGPRRTWSR